MIKEISGDKGDTGEAGLSATITVGTTSTGLPGTEAVVVNSGDSTSAIFDFVIPRGDKGDTGEAGTTDYLGLTNQPQINSVTLVNNKSLEDLNINSLTNLEIENLINSVV